MVDIGSIITTISFTNTSASVKAGEPVTFGQRFKKGDLPSASAAVDLVSPLGATVLCQMDVKTTHSDGTVKMAVLSAIVPLGASATDVYSIRRRAAPPTGTAPVPADFAGLNATVLLTDMGIDISGPITGLSYTADATAKLAAGQYETSLSGPIVSEWTLRLPLKTAGNVENPDLHARVWIRAYAGTTRARIRFAVENTWAKPKADQSTPYPWENVSTTEKVYRASLQVAGATVYTRSKKGSQTTKFNYGQPGTGAKATFDDYLTGLPNNGTLLTATITIDGVAKPISIAGSAAQTYGQLKSLLNTQMGGAGTVASDVFNTGLLFQSATTGPGSTVVIAYGTLFPALLHVDPYRPIVGDEVMHRAGTSWTKTFWWGAASTVHFAQNRAYLTSTRAVPHYDPTLTGDATTIAAKLATIRALSDIGDAGITKAYFGDVGFAPGIGILPEWCAMHLISFTPDTMETMLKQADLALGWPVVKRDFNTDLPINFTTWPCATTSPNIGDSYNAASGKFEQFPVPVGSTLPPNPNQPDTAHCPDFFTLPYMLTGDPYYLEGLLFYQRYTCFLSNASVNYRNGGECLLWRDQVRSQAWSLRTMLHALDAIPSTHPLHADITYILGRNLNWYTANYLTPGVLEANLLGVLRHDGSTIYAGNIGVGAFQDDFFTAVMGRANELDRTEWAPMLHFKAKFPVGRLTSGVDFCWQLGGSLLWFVIKSAPGSPIFTNFNQVYTGTFNSTITSAQCGSAAMRDAMLPLEGSRSTLNSMAGYPDIIGGYPSNMQGAVAYAATFDATNGDNAWTVFEGRSLKPNYNLGPQFAIVPYTVDGGAVVVDPPPPPPTGTTMAIADRVKDSTTTTGTGAITLAGAPPTNFQAFNNPSISVGSVLPYSIAHRTLNEWENGFGTLTSALLLTRTTVTSNSLGTTAPVNFSAGTKDVTCDLTAALVGLFARADSPVALTIGDSATAALLIEEDGEIKRITVDDFITSSGVEVSGLTAAGALADADLTTVVQGGVEYKVALSTLKAYYAAGGAADTTKPTFVSAQVANASPAVIVITMSEALAAFTPATSAFAVSGGRTVSSVLCSGSTVSLTVNSAYANGDVITATYTKPGSNQLQDAAGNQVDTFGPSAVTNNVAASDIVAPSFSSAQVADAAPTLVVITMSETLAAFTPATSAFALSGGKTVTNVARSGATITLTASAAYVNGDVITVTYTKPGSNQLRDAAGNETASFGPSSVTNNVAAAATPTHTVLYYNGNTVNTTIDAAGAPTVGGFKYITPAAQSSNLYFGSDPTETTARFGWGTSATVPPAEIAGTLNSGGNTQNGLCPMSAGAAPYFENTTFLWVPVGGGSLVRYPWFKAGASGTPICLVPGGVTVNNA